MSESSNENSKPVAYCVDPVTWLYPFKEERLRRENPVFPLYKEADRKVKSLREENLIAREANAALIKRVAELEAKLATKGSGIELVLGPKGAPDQINVHDPVAGQEYTYVRATHNVATLTDQISKLHEQLAGVQGQHAYVASDRDRIRNEKAQVCNDRDKLRGRIKFLEEKVADLEKQAEGKQQRIESLRGMNAAHLRRIDELSTTAERIKAEAAHPLKVSHSLRPRFVAVRPDCGESVFEFQDPAYVCLTF